MRLEDMKLEKLFGGIVAVTIFANVAIVWLAASIVTSAVKAGTDSCGTTYPVEAVLAGDWFCPKE